MYFFHWTKLCDKVIFLQGIKIPANTEIAVLLPLLHRDERSFPNPEKFDPERFDPVNGSFKHKPFAYMPFAAGIRSCPGHKFGLMEMKTVISWILRKYVITTEVPREEYDRALTPMIALHAGDGNQLQIKKRQY